VVNDSDLIVLYGSNGEKNSTVKGDTTIAPYFKARELACPTGFVVKCHDGFLLELSLLRKRYGYPIVLDSCCRSPQHNIGVGGHVNSLHLTYNPKHPTTGAMAADINVEHLSQSNLNKLIGTAWALGWSIGRGDRTGGDGVFGHIHIDRRVDIGLPQIEYHY